MYGVRKMHTKKLSAWSIGMIYIGAVIGAGFASGQELLQFFVQFGKGGVLGLLLNAFCFSFLGAGVLLVANKISARTWGDFVRCLFGIKLGRLANMLIAFQLCCGLLVMLSGGGSILNEGLGCSRLWGTVFTALCVSMTVWFGAYGVAAANKALIPFLLAFGTVVFGLVLWAEGFPSLQVTFLGLGNPLLRNWFISAFLYLGSNLLTAAIILSTISAETDRSGAFWGGIIGGTGLGMMALIFCLILWAYYPEIAVYQIPLSYAAGLFGEGVRICFGFAVWAAMYTTAIGCALSIGKELALRTGLSLRLCGTGAVLALCPFAGLPFARLVGTLYPFTGAAALLLFFLLLCRFTYQGLHPSGVGD